VHFTKEDIQKRRKRLESGWDDILKENEAVLVHSGALIFKPGGLDQAYPFLPHPSYYWLTARRREQEVVLYSKNTGWVEFHKEISKEQVLWEGAKTDLLLVQNGRDIKELEAFLKSGRFSAIYNLGQFSGDASGEQRYNLDAVLNRVRRIKDEAEIKLIRNIAKITALGYRKISQLLKPGISEKELQIAYESELYLNGVHAMPYDTVVGSGSNAAILHTLPGAKTINEKELVLIDAGADIYDYCVDVTRTFASSENMDSRQKALYSLVLNAQESCMQMCMPGVQWRDVHTRAATVFTQGLLDLGILKGSFSDLIEREVIALFFPHGVGHLVGLRVRDTGQEENKDARKCFGVKLRVDLQLMPGHLITVEPGLYFIEALLSDSENISRFRNEINWQELEKWKGIGGVRIEDNILISETGSENLTAGIPKQRLI